MSKFAFAAIGAAVSMTMQADPALARCSPRCANIEASSQPTSIMPSPLDFSLGERFEGSATRIDFSSATSFSLDLTFGFQIGDEVFSKITINRDGALTFNQNSPTITGLTIPTIAAYRANLAEGKPTSGDPQVGSVYYQTGRVDPYPDSQDGKYDRSEERNAVRIVWYGVDQLSAAGAPAEQVFAEIILTGDKPTTATNINNSFAFRWGNPNTPLSRDSKGAPIYGQPDNGGVAGFAFYNQAYTSQPDPSTKAYRTDVSFSTFDMQNGRVVSAFFGVPDTAVPEPDSWALMLLGFGLTGAALRRRSAGQVAKPSRNAATLAPSAATA